MSEEGKVNALKLSRRIKGIGGRKIPIVGVHRHVEIDLHQSSPEKTPTEY